MSQTIVIELGEELRDGYQALTPEETITALEAAAIAVKRVVDRAARRRRYAAMSGEEAAAEFRRICGAASENLTDADRVELAAILNEMS